MKRFGWGLSSSLAGTFFAVMMMAHPTQALAQDTASMHGHVQNPVGMPIANGEVRLAADRSPARKYLYTFPTDAKGDYKGADIKPGTYVGFVFQGETTVDMVENIVVKKGDDKLVDFDETRQEYMDRLTPEEKQKIAEVKSKNAAAMSANTQIAQVNGLLNKAREDIKAGNYDAAVTGMQQATVAKPDASILWLTLGDAQVGAADTAAKTAKAAGKPVTDPEVQGKYNDAITSYKKAIDLDVASKKPNPETMAAAQNELGTAYGKMGDEKNSADAYDAAAKAMPANAGMYYYNAAAILYNAGKTDASAAAADKAIAADPKRADAYYLKGQSLIPKASVDPQTQKITVPPGCVEAYQQYLELDPDGPHAAEVKQILGGIGAEVKSSYKADKPSTTTKPKPKK